MSCFVATGTAQQTISTEKITGCIKNIEEEYRYYGFSINSFPVSVFFLSASLSDGNMIKGMSVENGEVY